MKKVQKLKPTYFAHYYPHMYKKNSTFVTGITHIFKQKNKKNIQLVCEAYKVC